ncbi:MAG: hypothetical protein QOD48_705 [Gaiellaceae bacterium]|nr:hypothetical protein [Gaiellaceae bacterium]
MAAAQPSNSDGEQRQALGTHSRDDDCGGGDARHTETRSTDESSYVTGVDIVVDGGTKVCVNDGATVTSLAP